MKDKIDRTKEDDTANLSLGKSSLVGAAGKFTLALFGFIGIVFFYRDLGPGKIGAYYTILAGVKITVQFQNAITSAIRKRVSEIRADQAEYLGLGLLTWIGTTATGVIVVFLVDPLLARYDLSVIQITGGVAMVSALGLFGTINQFYAGIGNPGKGIWIDAARSVLTLAGQVMLVLFGYEELGLIGGFIFGTATTAVGLLLRVGVIPTLPSFEIVTRTVDFAKWALANGLANNIYNRLDVLVLWIVLGTTSVGQYQPALQLTMPATFVAASLTESQLTKMSGLDSQGEPVIGVLQKTVGYAGLIAIPVVFGAMAIPEALMGIIFGPSARAAAGVLVWMALFQLINSYLKVISTPINATDHPELNQWVILPTVVLNLPIAILLVQRFGLIGVVAATVIAEAFRLLLTILITVRLVGNPGIPREIFEQLISAFLMFVVVEGLTVTGLVPMTDVLRLAIIIGLGGFVYFISLIIISDSFRSSAQHIATESSLF